MSVLSQFTGGSSTLPFKVSPTAIPIEALVLGGGGGGGSYSNSTLICGGGGGAGRLVSLNGVLVNPGETFGITVGQPGTAGLYNSGVPIRAGSGQNSSIGILQAEGGGGGATNGTTLLSSGGGCGGGGAIAGDAGPPVLPSTASYNVNSLGSASITGSYGTSGGSGGVSYSPGGPYYNGGGGGGTSGFGVNGLPNSGGSGGPGTLSAITGINVYYGGGGGGAGYINNTASLVPGGLGGAGGGGNGAGFNFGAYVPRTNGETNTGSGGGGATFTSTPDGGAGGSGIVIIAYKDTYPLATTTGAPTLYSAFNPDPLVGPNATRTGYHVYVFTGAGSITFN